MSDFVRLSELEGSTLASALPEYEVPEHVAIGDRLAVDVTRLGSIASWAGFYPDLDLHAYNGEVTKTNVSVVGADDHNTAVGGGVSTVQARLARPDFTRNALTRTRTHLDLRVNTAELEQQVDNAHKPRRDPNSWVTPLDRALREGLREAAWQHLVRDPVSDYERNEVLHFAGMIGALFVFAVGKEAVGGGDIGSVVRGLSIGSLLALEVRNAVSAIHHRDKGALFSLLPLWHADRAALVSVRTRTPGSLVKAIK